MAVLRDVINTVDQSKEVAAEVKEALSLLMDLAQARANEARKAIEADLTNAKMGESLEVAITKVIDRKVQYRSVVTADLTGLAGTIAKAIKPMFSGSGDISTKIVDGVASLVDEGMRAILGCGTGSESNVEMYAVVAEYPAAIVRYDFSFWGRNIAAESIKKYTESAFACVAFKSAVDLRKLDFNAFLSIYGPVLDRAFNGDETKIKQAIAEAKEIYALLCPSQLDSALSNDQAAVQVVRGVRQPQLIFVHAEALK